MNLIEIFVNVDKGTELYSPLFKDPLTFLHIDYSNILPIRCLTKEGFVVGFSKEGYYADIPVSLTCVLFPNSEMTWDNIIYVKEGDLLVCNTKNKNVIQYFIAKETGFYNINNRIPCYSGIGIDGKIFDTDEYYICVKGKFNDFKEFKKVLTKYNYYLEGYSINKKESKKFDFSSLKPFDKVLVRDNNEGKWNVNMFSHCDKRMQYKYKCFGNSYIYCIPYNDDTKHLVGTTMSAPEFYRE